MAEKTRGMFVTDLDGTLLRTDRTLAPRDLGALELLGEVGMARVIATGRMPYSFKRLMGGRVLPVDYLILSTGTGIVDYARDEILLSRGHSPEEAAEVCGTMIDLDLDFFVQDEFPENHRSWYRSTGRENPDFYRRLSFYHEWATVYRGPEPGWGRPSQIVAVVPAESGVKAYLRAAGLLGEDFSVVRTTSPLDGESMWIEIFPPGVSKGSAAAWLASLLGIGHGRTAAVGNDYNDGDLLAWAGSSYVVANAPAGFCPGSTSVAANDECGVAMAVEHWLNRTGAGR
jgi:hydroxymethylpyrimidine pyrophosphatase-like HAD family hydrolase